MLYTEGSHAGVRALGMVIVGLKDDLMLSIPVLGTTGEGGLSEDKTAAEGEGFTGVVVDDA